MELGCRSFVEMEWPYYLSIIVTYSTPGPNQHICVLLPVTLPQPGLGRIAEQVLVAKMRSSSLH